MCFIGSLFISRDDRLVLSPADWAWVSSVSLQVTPVWLALLSQGPINHRHLWKTSLEQIMPISLSTHISATAWQGFFFFPPLASRQPSGEVHSEPCLARCRASCTSCYKQGLGSDYWPGLSIQKEIVADGLWLDLKFTQISKSGTDMKCRPGV